MQKDGHSPVLPAAMAALRIGNSDVAYCRSGSAAGAPLLLLVEDANLRDRLRARFKDSFRVYSLSLQDTAPDIATRALLRGVIDGLGLDQPHLLADEARGLAVMDYVISDPQRVGRIALFWREPATALYEEPVLEEQLAFTACSLLLVRLDGSCNAAGDASDPFAAIARFLGHSA